MNTYGKRAQQAWQQLAPSAYAQIPDPNQRFSTLGREAQNQIADLTTQLAGPDEPRESDVAVLCATHAAADSVATALRGAHVPVQPLENYIGIQADAVKVGTIKRAKGLEFKHVLLSHVPHSMTTPAPPVHGDLDRWVLGQRELFVAMTRARDELWVGILR